jgi:hypothetical protein
MTIDLAKVKDALAKATPGPWIIYDTPLSPHGGIGQPDSDEAVLEDGTLQAADAHLIAQAPTWLAQLIKELELVIEDRHYVSEWRKHEAAKVDALTAERDAYRNILQGMADLKLMDQTAAALAAKVLAEWRKE